MSNLNFNIDLGSVMKLAEATGSTGINMRAKLLIPLTTSAIAIQGIARTQAPTRTGRLVNSIGYKIKDLTATISPSVKYAGYVEMGTGIYGPKGEMIVPKQKKVLASKINPGWGSASNGYYVIGRSSKGQKANPFMARTAELAKPIVEGYFKVQVGNIVRDFKV